ncbi:Hvo_1808 family surface protein [Halovenus halobia]|uniref:Hvo_1808 family surface protein n=1 Tax=Halovenus halobia TaxID=3396622 RepID=UPI003F57C8C5
MRRVVQLLAVVVALTALAVAPGAATAIDGDTASGQTLADGHVGECAVTPPSDHADPENPDGVIGWVEGYWYNEPVSVTPDDGFNQSELDRLARRTAAQVESLRCLDYVDGLPPLQTISRDQYRENVAGQVANQTTAEGELYENAQYAARMTIGSEVDALEAFVDAQAAFPAAFYRPDQDYMAFVTDDETVEGLRQSTLAHELVHALQDQYFDVGAIFEKPTNDGYLAAASVVESDAQFFQEQYTANCNSGAWADDCITPARGTPPEIPNWAITLNQQFQYTSPLIDATYEEGGTEAIDNLFGNFPETTTESIYPDRFGEFETADITVEDQSGSAWRRVQSGNLAYNTIGQAGMTAMFMAPYYETDGSTNVVSDIREFIPQRGVLDYGIPETDGWRGDKLYGYANDANETGAVWESAWDSSADAAEFASTYEALIEYRGARLASGYENAYTFDTEEYDMAAAVTQTDEQVLVVTAPTVEELTGVHESVSLQSTDTDDSDAGDSDDSGASEDDADDGGSSDDGSSEDGGSDDGSSEDGDSDDGSSDDGGPGFGILAAAVAVLGCGFWLARR